MDCQKHLFSIDPEISYLNNAYRGPLLKASENAALTDLGKMRNPQELQPSDFFTETEEVRGLFAQLISAETDEIAFIPSTSYGFAIALSNWTDQKGKKAITVKDEFPSGYFAVIRWAEEQEVSLEVIGEDAELSWNDKILAAIDEYTALVLISSVHWMNGYIFDLEAIGAKCQKVGACFIVDGTQSVGAKPIDVKACKIDALICATYKWLLGPYSLGLAYFGEKFEGGKPLEESWMNRINSRNFSELTNYRQEFLPKAHRFDVGESSHFILMPILKKSLEQILKWSTEEIQHYTSDLKKYLFESLELDPFHAQSSSNHLFALPLKPGLNPQILKSELENEKVFVSVRGQSLRVSLHLYNDQRGIQRLVSVLEKS